jgi:hypothetical protein
MIDDSAAEALKARVRADLQAWLHQGIDISIWSVNQDTGTLKIGVRTPTAEATEPLRERYGPGTEVYYADIRPGDGRSAAARHS